jgi:hypothetical protein
VDNNNLEWRYSQASKIKDDPELIKYLEGIKTEIVPIGFLGTKNEFEAVRTTHYLEATSEFLAKIIRDYKKGKEETEKGLQK